MKPNMKIFDSMKLIQKLSALSLMLGIVACGNNTQKPMETEFTDSITTALANQGNQQPDEV